MKLESSISPKNKKKSNIKHLGSSALLAILLALTPMNNNTKAQEISNNFTNTKTTSIFTKTEKAPDSTYQQLNIENFTSTKNTQEEKSLISNFEVVEADNDTIKEISNAIKEQKN